MQRLRIMNPCFYPTRVQVPPHCIPVLYPNNKKVEVVLSDGWYLWDLNACVSESHHICFRMPDTAHVPFPKMTKFHREHSRLNCIKPRVRPDHDMNVLRRTTVISQESQPFRLNSIMACNNPRISVGTQVFARIEAETGEPARSAYADTISLYPVRLRSIFDDCESAPLGQFLQSRHVHCPSI